MTDRCLFCNKKLKGVYKLMPVCRCTGRFCAKHRLPETHRCTFDLQKHGLVELGQRLQAQSTQSNYQTLFKQSLNQF